MDMIENIIDNVAIFALGAFLAWIIVGKVVK